MASKRKPATGEGRYTLVKNDDADSFVIPVEKLDEWFAWLGLDEDDPASWNVPSFAREVGVMLTFTDPQGLRENDDLWRQITCGSRVPVPRSVKRSSRTSARTTTS